MVLLYGTEATADTVAFSPTAPVFQAFQPNAPVNLGLVFSVNSDITVDALGIYDQPYLTAPETVGLYNAAGDLLDFTTVTLSDRVVNGYRFQSIAPFTLPGGQFYTVDAFVGNNDWS